MNENTISEHDVELVVRNAMAHGRHHGYLDGIAAGKSLGRALAKRQAFWLRLIGAVYGATLATLVYGVIQLAARGAA